MKHFPDWIFIPAAIVGALAGMFLLAWARGVFRNNRRKP